MPEPRGPARAESAIHRLASRLLRDLAMPPSAVVEDLCERLGASRRRPIVLVPRPFPATSAFGLWLKTADTDLVIYEQDATREHQRHIIHHEVGHIVFDHDGASRNDDPLNADDALHALVPSLPLHVVRTALRRSCYDTTAEWEAEVFASVVTDLTGHRRTGGLPRWSLGDPVGGGVRRSLGLVAPHPGRHDAAVREPPSAAQSAGHTHR